MNGLSLFDHNHVSGKFTCIRLTLETICSKIVEISYQQAANLPEPCDYCLVDES